uniref:Uncharacterized protein n=1 Tax=Rhodosorus marinus TaxID=101924 RepID=A0A7S3EFH4_9RHOD|mmetsp:Transcript_32431/g.127213  ORF Transcript_32431/g.127213 Transcript_32431/m.127213 type:complete len:169 (+) Transcript_32431:2336-2842(+)
MIVVAGRFDHHIEEQGPKMRARSTRVRRRTYMHWRRSIVKSKILGVSFARNYMGVEARNPLNIARSGKASPSDMADTPIQEKALLQHGVIDYKEIGCENRWDPGLQSLANHISLWYYVGFNVGLAETGLLQSRPANHRRQEKRCCPEHHACVRVIKHATVFSKPVLEL